MSPCLVFHNLIWKLSAYDQFSKTDERITLYYMYQTKNSVIFSQVLFYTLIIVHDLNTSRKCEILFVIPSCEKILHDIFWKSLDNSSDPV